MGRMQRFEKLVVNSPLVSWYHKRIGVPRVLEHLRRPVDGPILEVGCGTGATTIALRRQLRRHAFTAIDYDPDQVKRAQKRLGPDAVVEQGDVTRLAYPDNTFGLVIEMNVLHHIPEPLRGLEEIHRVLKPGGQFLFMDYAWKSYRPVALKLFPPESVFSASELGSAITAAGFRSVAVHGERQVTGRGRKAGEQRPAWSAASQDAHRFGDWPARRHPL